MMISDSDKLSSTRSTAVCGLAAALAMGFFAGGCGEEQQQAPAPPPTQNYKLEVAVANEADEPLPKAPVLIDGKRVGYTDAKGLFQAVLTERAGAQIQVSVGEMEDYVFTEEPTITETLKIKKSLEGGMATVPVTLDVTAKSARKDYLVWLELTCGEHLDEERCADVPVTLNGEPVAVSDEAGAAHFSFKGVPGDKVTVGIDTPTYEPSPDDGEDDVFTMKPSDPEYEIELGLDSEVLVIEEVFSDPVAAEKAKKKPRRRYRPPRRSRSKPKAKPKPKPKPKPEKKEDGVIDLW